MAYFYMMKHLQDMSRKFVRLWIVAVTIIRNLYLRNQRYVINHRSTHLVTYSLFLFFGSKLATVINPYFIYN